ncbi:MAG TPA: DUF92 domain-containing protein [Chloroflexota bacterium]|nr:DUF92 domain-containing protein [Chloroflexota bacterium]
MNLQHSVARLGGSALAAAGLVGLVAWRKQALTADGALAATTVGAVVLARGGPPAAASLVAFFVTSTALSRFKQREKARRGVLAQAKGGPRDAWQVLANGGAAAACLALWGRRGAAGYLGALATAGADTWATELGLLARKPPRLISTLRPVPPGTSGAITPEGTMAAVAGAATVGAVWQLAQHLWPDSAFHGAFPRSRYLVPIVSAIGMLGALTDSILGAAIQGSYWCPICQEPSEAPVHPRCGQKTNLVRGWSWITNDAVNALATASGAAMGAVVGAAVDALGPKGTKPYRPRWSAAMLRV